MKLLKLKSLNVDFNPIGDVPQEIIKLKSLEEFTCTSTNLEGNSLPSNTFEISVVSKPKKYLGLPEFEPTKHFLLSLPCFLSDFSPSASTKSPISHLSSRDRSRKSSKVIDIFALNEEREKLQYLGTMGGALLLQGEGRKIHYLPPAICKCRAPASVVWSSDI